MSSLKTNDMEIKHENRDPITGEPGSHPIGTGIGAAVGATAGLAGAAATGAALGTVIGPVGTVIGAAIGGLIGGLAGSAAGEDVNPTDEHAYWNENYKDRPYAEQGTSYDTYKSAYNHGIEAYKAHNGRDYSEIEPDLKSQWTGQNNQPLSWDKAGPATRDAYDRLAKQRTTN